MTPGRQRDPADVHPGDWVSRRLIKILSDCVIGTRVTVVLHPATKLRTLSCNRTRKRTRPTRMKLLSSKPLKGWSEETAARCRTAVRHRFIGWLARNDRLMCGLARTSTSTSTKRKKKRKKERERISVPRGNHVCYPSSHRSRFGSQMRRGFLVICILVQAGPCHVLARVARRILIGRPPCALERLPISVPFFPSLDSLPYSPCHAVRGRPPHAWQDVCCKQRQDAQPVTCFRDTEMRRRFKSTASTFTRTTSPTATTSLGVLTK